MRRLGPFVLWASVLLLGACHDSEAISSGGAGHRAAADSGLETASDLDVADKQLDVAGEPALAPEHFGATLEPAIADESPDASFELALVDGRLDAVLDPAIAATCLTAPPWPVADAISIRAAQDGC